MNIERSTLFIVDDIQLTINKIITTLPLHSSRVIQNEEDGKTEFQMQHAQKAIKEAYISARNTKYILLCGDSFRVEAQNSLLKLLEEPPRNIIFILITKSKNSILPTILSRIQLSYRKIKKEFEQCLLDINNLDLKKIYMFIKENQRVSKVELKDIIESILYAYHKNNIKLSQDQLNSFDRAMRLIELNSRPVHILTTLLINLVKLI